MQNKVFGEYHDAEPYHDWPGKFEHHPSPLRPERGAEAEELPDKEFPHAYEGKQEVEDTSQCHQWKGPRGHTLYTYPKTAEERAGKIHRMER